MHVPATGLRRFVRYAPESIGVLLVFAPWLLAGATAETAMAISILAFACLVVIARARALDEASLARPQLFGVFAFGRVNERSCTSSPTFLNRNQIGLFRGRTLFDTVNLNSVPETATGTGFTAVVAAGAAGAAGRASATEANTAAAATTALSTTSFVRVK